MIQSDFHNFSVKIIQKPFYTEGNVSYPSTAFITFFDNNGKFISSHDYGYISTDEIYAQIERDACVNLDYCYVNNFSFTAFRRVNLMGKKECVELKSISAKRAFFNSEYVIDFSFLNIVDGDVNFSETCFVSAELLFAYSNFRKGVVDFSGALFRTDKSDFSNAVFSDCKVVFKNSIFLDGFKNFQYTDFGKGDLSFVNVDFGNGGVSFLNTNFNEGKTSFKVALFGEGKVNFHFSTFGRGDISFERTNFGDGVVDFKAASFGIGKVNFNRANFGIGDVLFEGSSSEGRITFKKTFFGKGILSFELAEFDNTEVDFAKATFEECALSFLNGVFLRLILKGCHFDNYLDMRVRKCVEIDLSDTVVRDIIDFKQYDFNVEIDVLNIAAIRLLGVIYIDWDNNSVQKIIDNQQNTTIAEKAEQFRILKESFNTTGQYSDEDKSYVLFSRYNMRAEYDKSLKFNSWKVIYEKPIYYFKKLVFDHVGLYATEPLRVLFSMLATYVVFSLIFVFVLAFEAGDIVSGLGGEHSLLGILGRSFYHSGITFFTIGYGDFYPMGAMRWLSQLEGFIGVFLMSYFTVAFVHKVLR